MSATHILTPPVNYSTIPSVNNKTTPSKANGKKTSGGGNKKGTSAERRATHNAVERARRETLNVRFLELAANLPTICTVRRPSKNLIVNKSLEFVRNALHNDAVLRLKLEESSRQNQSLLQELNQMRAERGLSPRAHQTTSIDANQQTGFSIDALNTAYGLPGLPQPLASVEFTKQVTEHGIQVDAQSANWYGEGDEDIGSNTASNDDFSTAASDHSSPSLADEASVTAAAVAAVNGYPNNSIFQNFNNMLSTPQATTFASLQPVNNGHAKPSPPAINCDVPNTYAHYAVGSGAITNPATNLSSLDFMQPITPTTAAVFASLMNNGTQTAQQPLQYSTYAMPQQLPNENNMNSTNGVHGNGNNYTHNNYYAMTA